MFSNDVDVSLTPVSCHTVIYQYYFDANYFLENNSCVYCVSITV